VSNPFVSRFLEPVGKLIRSFLFAVGLSAGPCHIEEGEQDSVGELLLDSEATDIGALDIPFFFVFKRSELHKEILRPNLRGGFEDLWRKSLSQ
jgi:hypothetical protein